MPWNCITPIPIIRPVGISERISFASVVAIINIRRLVGLTALGSDRYDRIGYLRLTRELAPFREML